jgi:hypothetical protein
MTCGPRTARGWSCHLRPTARRAGAGGAGTWRGSSATPSSGSVPTAPPRLPSLFRLPLRRGGMHFGPARRALSLRESRGWRRCGVTPQGASAQRWLGRQILRCGCRSRARSSRPWTETASAGAPKRARGKLTCTSPTKNSSKMTGASPARAAHACAARAARCCHTPAAEHLLCLPQGYCLVVLIPHQMALLLLGVRVAQRAAAKCAAAAGARGRGSEGCASSTRSRSHAGARRAPRGAPPVRSARTGRVRTKPGRVRRPMRTRAPRRLAVCGADRCGAGLCTRLCSRTWRWRRPAGARRAGRSFLRRSSTSGTTSAC